MLDAVRLLSGSLDAGGGGAVSAGLRQSDIKALPSIMGPVGNPDGDTTARVDRTGQVYLWEPGHPAGFWVHAGYVRHGRPRFGQVIDPNDIQWFELGIYKKKLLQAINSVNAVELSHQDDIWDVAKEPRRERDYPEQDWMEEGSVRPRYGVPDDGDIE